MDPTPTSSALRPPVQVTLDQVLRRVGSLEIERDLLATELQAAHGQIAERDSTIAELRTELARQQSAPPPTT